MTEPHGLFENHDSPNLSILLEWAKSNGITLHPNLKVQETEYGGWGVFSTGPIGLNELLCQIPKSALLSTRSPSLPPILPTTKDITSHSILHLALVLLHEIRLGRESRWYGYLQALPRETIKLPLFWGIEELCGDDGRKGSEWLKGTEVEKDLRRRAEMGFSLPDLNRFYTTCKPHLPPTQTHPHPSPFSAFLHTYSLICTRTFAIDLYHTIALVPLADLFNHNTQSHTSLSSDDFVCHICGSLAPCPHDPLNRDGEPFRLQHLDSHTRKRIGVEIDTVEMRVERDISEVGGEVWNSYGSEIGDARLLVEWGFVVGDFAGYGLTWDVEELVGGKEKVKEMWEFLRASGEDKGMDVPDWRSAWKEINPRNGFHGADGEEEDDSLLCGIVEGQPDLMNLSQAGQISINIWALYWIQYTQNSSILTLGEEIVNSFKRIEAIWTDGEAVKENTDKEEQSDLLATARRIRSMLQSRLAGLHNSDLPMEELLDMQENLPKEGDLQKMAMTININERSLLASAVAKWDEVVKILEEAR